MAIQMSKTSSLFKFTGACAVVVAGIFGLNTVSGLVFKGPTGPLKDGYAIATGAAVAATPASPAAPVQAAAAEPAPAAINTAASSAGPDAGAGKAVFSKCKACHTLDASGKNAVGPNLYGVVNRPVAAAAGYKYSDAMKGKSPEVWSPSLLDQYLADVKGVVPGTKMTFAGLTAAGDRANLIAYLAQNSATPIAAADLGLAAAAAAPVSGTEASAPAAAEAPAPEPVTYTDPPAPTEKELADEKATADALAASIQGMDYQRARYHPLHFKPAIDTATNSQCLVCHQEVLETQVRDHAPDGLKAQDAKAWYQTLATYDGAQMTFHQRHLSSPYAKAVMNLKCTFCHQGNDPREEATQVTVSAADMASNNGSEPFTLRKMVNPSETCLRCHGAMPDPQNIMGLPGPWPQARKDLESADTPNGCLTCHGETIRTNRHKVTYLNAATIEDLAKESSDVCYGCHGGRAWYRKSYAYPRHPWPGMDPATPEWAKDRKTESDPRYVITDTAQ
jgi:cytochrome c2